MRPDERLLVPVKCLPFVPEGAWVWAVDPEQNIGRPYVEQALASMFYGDGALLDLSAPALRDGVPERLDVLPWALGVLGWRNEPGAEWRMRKGWWPDLSGLGADGAARAVVAAALRQRHRP